MIKQIKELRPQSHRHVFRQVRVLENGEIKLLETRGNEGIAPFVSEVASACHAIALVGCARIERWIPGARSGKRRQIQVLRRITGILRGSDHIRPIKSLAGSRVITLEFIVQLPGLSILQIEDSVRPQPFLSFDIAPAIFGNW